MSAVCDAGPLIALGRLGQLDLLLKLHSEVVVASEVYHEVVTEGVRIGAADAAAVDLLVRNRRIQVVAVPLPAPLPDWAGAIDPGEVATIILAQQRPSYAVLIDDAHARQAARSVGLTPKGTVGLLLQGFRSGHLSAEEFALLMEGIKAEPTLWISDSLCDEALRRVRHGLTD
ncbi:MAG TPA: hypothetical protein VNE39_07130 [Planctomycetota bacterium]|nr:hypothetical protein [Planctomycetota bacterium]